MNIKRAMAATISVNNKLFILGGMSNSGDKKGVTSYEI